MMLSCDQSRASTQDGQHLSSVTSAIVAYDIRLWESLSELMLIIVSIDSVKAACM